MDQLVKGFFNNSLTGEEYHQLYQGVKNKKTYPSIYKRPESKISECQKVENVYLSDQSCSIAFANGLVLTLFKAGNLTVTYDSKPVEIDENLILKMPAHCLARMYDHIIRLHKLDNAIAQSEIIARKDRYIHTGNKKAFIAGMLTGQKITRS